MGRLFVFVLRYNAGDHIHSGTTLFRDGQDDGFTAIAGIGTVFGYGKIMIITDGAFLAVIEVDADL